MIAALLFLIGTASADDGATKVGTRDGIDLYRFELPRPHVLPVLRSVVVVLDASSPIPDELRARGVHLGGPSWRVPAADPIAEAARWAAVAGVRIAEPNVVLPHRGAGFDDPSYGGQWYLEEIGMSALFDVSQGDPATLVAIIDSAIEITHPDLAAGILAPLDVASGDLDPSPNPGEYCPGGGTEICDEHGTAVTGIVGARANNAIGIVGLCPECSLVPIKMLAEGGSPLGADVQAYEHVIAENVAVVNNSWGFTESIPAPAALADAIHRAATETRGGLGTLVVFAAGNDDREIFDDEVEALPDVLCVSAVDSYGRPTAYTNSGASIDVSAPSATVTLTVGGGVMKTFGGTSAAAPVVSGLAGWVSSVAPKLSAQEMSDLLVSTANQSPLITPDENGHHAVYGYGIIDPPEILERLFPPDAGDAGPDAGTEPDAGGETEKTDEGGCSCRTTSTRGGGALLLLALLSLRATRAGTRRSSRTR